MAKRSALHMSLAQVQTHADRHGHSMAAEAWIKLNGGQPRAPGKAKSIKKDRMTKPEREYGLILEAQKRRGEVKEYRFEGISLSWGADPETGKPMWYTPDFYIIDLLEKVFLTARLVEVKGPHIYPKDLIRFKGCRAEWPMFKFEMWQRERTGQWNRVH